MSWLGSWQGVSWRQNPAARREYGAGAGGQLGLPVNGVCQPSASAGWGRGLILDGQTALMTGGVATHNCLAMPDGLILEVWVRPEPVT